MQFVNFRNLKIEVKKVFEERKIEMKKISEEKENSDEDNI